MARERILIVEDEEDIIEMISYNLKKEKYEVISVTDGENAVSVVKAERPSLIILDLMLPKLDGLEVCRILKSHDLAKKIPIIMLTAKSQETDKVIGLELGADDYITKPFSPKELIARIRAVLRRYKSDVDDKTVEISGIVIDRNRFKVTISGKDIILTPKEFKILEFMAKRPGRVLSRDKILDGVFGYESSVYDRTVDAHIKSLRKKLGKAKTCIETVRGMGYRFNEK